MDTLFKKMIGYQIVLIFFLAIFLMGLETPAISYYGFGIPNWTSNINVGQNNWWGGSYYSDYQSLSNPYLIGPAMGLYYPYNTQFNIYDRAYAYGANTLGFYNTGSGQQDVNSIGYPYPYAYTNQMAWNNQAGFMGNPPAGNYGNVYNVFYNPGAFTMDLGIDAYYTGIGNFWGQVFQDLNEEEEE